LVLLPLLRAQTGFGHLPVSTLIHGALKKLKILACLAPNFAKRRDGETQAMRNGG
jgi:hypothetical protein